jgi:hypothetical protein
VTDAEEIHLGTAVRKWQDWPDGPDALSDGHWGGLAMHGCVRSRLLGRTSTRSDLTPPCQLNNLLRQNT